MSSIQSQKNKTLADLERELEAEAQFIQTRPVQPAPKPKKSNFFGKLIGVAVLLGLPVGLIWVANLPYPVIRRPVAQKAPLLLLPSYASIDRNYREGIINLETAEQLLQNTTSAADIALGKEKLAAAKQNFDAIPLWFVEDWSDYDYWWYRSRFDRFAFNQYRAQIGQLEAIAFQEGNAQTSLSGIEGGINAAKQRYAQATTPEAKQAAIASWKAAIDHLEQISGQTNAGETARKKFATYSREFEDIMASASRSDRVTTAVAAAKKYAWQAASASQNPPHNVAQWQQVETFWQEAIDQLKPITPDEGSGYVETQDLIAQYTANLEQVKIRRLAEEASSEALESAQRKIESLLASTPNDSTQVNWTGTAAQLQEIIRELEKVDNGTMAYAKAQELLKFAKARLQSINKS
ncbi:hypothetical protein [Oscillatoria sp. FACHB-1406]|uniref:hypothetical protein n=1 Tax=Oscillatoria sp. FACHB-1406 TaxID=2692846 RepID=UPI0016827754|nr:hypothetical protein [Oscillatoria sp. FACHB-1406]MBD2577752.1 hypothetical protein [Oscillatoria sp. FACHB-1406]